MSTIREVAKKAGVSITTVSRILSDDASFHVSAETKSRVIEAIRELNYQYTPKKEQLHIGCIMSLTYNYSDPYFNDILSGIQTYCSSHNAVISMIVSYNQIQELHSSLEKQLSELDGLIITEVPEGKLDFILQLNKKIVFVDNHVNGYCNVGYNEIYANRLVMNHLIDCGYRKIAYIGGPIDYPSINFHDFNSSARMMVIHETLRRNNIPFDPSLLYNCNWNQDICAAQLRELLTKHPDTQVIFAGSDSLAIVILSQLESLGYKCPDDIGVIGFNDAAFAKNYSPALSTLYLPAFKMGNFSAKVLIEQIKSGKVQEIEYLLPVELKARKSTRKII